jgi:hypothetical protein
LHCKFYNPSLRGALRTPNFLNKKFNHFNNKYPIEELLDNVSKIFTHGLSFRDISLYTNIIWITIYKFYKKLVYYNIFENIHKQLINKYLNEVNAYINKLYTDTTFINNLYGIENINYNPYNNKHKLFYEQSIINYRW